MASERSSLLLSSSKRRPRPTNATRNRHAYPGRGQGQGQGQGPSSPDLLNDSGNYNDRGGDVLHSQVSLEQQHEMRTTPHRSNGHETGGGFGGGRSKRTSASASNITSRGGHGDLIQLEEEMVPLPQSLPTSVPTTRSIKKLQARMQLRNKVQLRANGHITDSNDHRPQILYDDDDDDDDDDENDNGGDSGEYQTGQTAYDPGILLNMDAPNETATAANPTNISTSDTHGERVQVCVPPMDDFTTRSPIMNQNHERKSNAFRNLFRKDGMNQDLPLPSQSNLQSHSQLKSHPQSQTTLPRSKSVNSDPLSPPRPFKQPVKHAKRAVSTLFGSSVVVREEKKDNGLRHMSLLDVVSQGGSGGGGPGGSGSGPDSGSGRRWNDKPKHEGSIYNDSGLEMEQPHDRRREADLMDFTMDPNPSGGSLDFMQPNVQTSSLQHQPQHQPQPTSQQHQEHIQQQQQQQYQQYPTTNINVGDPFSYHARSTMNHRNTNVQQQGGNRNNNRGNASSVAKSWFGNPLNYTTSSIRMASPDKQQANRSGSGSGSSSGAVQEHQFLERLHQEGAEKTSFRDLRNHLNWLNIALFLSYGFTSAASCVPITLIPTIAMDVLSYGQGDGDGEGQSLEMAASTFASTVATYAVLGTAFGKFLNGPLGDIFGARRVACLYALLLSLALTILSCGYTGWGIIACCAAVEFFQSVQWPCVAVILAAHYGNDSLESSDRTEASNVRNNVAGRYEKGIYIASLGSRCGSLMASISTTMLLRYQQDSWRVVARLAAMGSFVGCVILYMFVTDSPGKVHDPQNPIKGSFQSSRPSRMPRSRGRDVTTISDIIEKIKYYSKMAIHVFTRNVVPSLRSVLSNGTFWVVAIAHSGGLMVCSSVRILGTYFRDTSNGAISENEAGAVTIFLSIGVLVGLALGGNAFSNLSADALARKKMIANLYIMTVTMCYALAFLAIPFVRKFLVSSTLVAIFQAAASFCMGAGVAVQVYCIPAIVGCTFGANKGLYASYTDGVACIVSSIVWRIVGNAVQEGNPQGSGWAYGWAAVALLVILAGLLMVEFVEYYFCRGGWLGRLRDANLRKNVNDRDPTGGADLNASFAESSKRLWENRPAIFRPRGQELESMLSIADDDTDDDASTIVFEDVTLPIDYNDIESSQLSKGPRDTKQEVLDLLEVKGNEICIDCASPFPRWVSIILPNRSGSNHRGASKPLQHQVACFCCTQCSGSHRKLGNHVVFVRSVDYDSFKSSEVLALRRGGNTKINGIYEALLQDLTAKPSPKASLATRERFITAKYKKKLWYEFEDKIPLYVESSFDNSTSMTSIELSRIHGNKAKPSVFETKAQFDRSTHDEYEAFVRRNDDSDSEYSVQRGKQKDDASLSSEDSGDWHISQTEMRGLDNLINL